MNCMPAKMVPKMPSICEASAALLSVRCVHEGFNETRQHRSDHAEGEHVERDGKKDEDGSGAARTVLLRPRGDRVAVECVRDLRLGSAQCEIFFVVWIIRHLT